MNKNNTAKLVAICPRTGAHLRDATAQEADAYELGNADKRARCFFEPVRMGEVTIEEYTGPGQNQWHLPLGW